MYATVTLTVERKAGALIVPVIQGGKLVVHGELSGTVDRPSVRGEVDGKALVLARTQFDSLTGTFQLNRESLTAEALGAGHARFTQAGSARRSQAGE